MGRGEDYSRNREKPRENPKEESIAPYWNQETFTVAGEQDMMG